MHEKKEVKNNSYEYVVIEKGTVAVRVISRYLGFPAPLGGVI